MVKIFIDFEMNKVHRQFKEVRQLCNQEIIEFGAVKLDENDREISRFQRYVCPEYNDCIVRNITALTGITTEQVQDADGFQEVLLQFLCWCGEEYEIYSWSSNDESQLRKEFLLKINDTLPEMEYMFAHWNDLQEMYGDLFEFSRPTALASAVSTAGMDFRGRLHNALDDASATADLYREMKSGSTIRKLRNEMTEAKKSIGTSLADLFANLQIA